MVRHIGTQFFGNLGAVNRQLCRGMASFYVGDTGLPLHAERGVEGAHVSFARI